MKCWFTEDVRIWMNSVMSLLLLLFFILFESLIYTSSKKQRYKNDSFFTPSLLFLVFCRPRNTEAVCAGLQAQILSCYRDNKDQTLKCSDLAKEYMQCINAAKKVRAFSICKDIIKKCQGWCKVLMCHKCNAENRKIWDLFLHVMRTPPIAFTYRFCTLVPLQMQNNLK